MSRYFNPNLIINLLVALQTKWGEEDLCDWTPPVNAARHPVNCSSNHIKLCLKPQAPQERFFTQGFLWQNKSGLFRANSVFVLLCSQEAGRHVARWLPDVPVLTGGLHLQTWESASLSGHEPAAQPLLHLLLAQHLPPGGPAPGTEQPGGLHPVRTLHTHTRHTQIVERR